MVVPSSIDFISAVRLVQYRDRDQCSLCAAIAGRHIQLFGNGRCLVVINDSQAGKVKVFLEEDNFIASAINEEKTKKLFDMLRIGEDYLLSVNETKRLVAFYSRRDVSPLAKTLANLNSHLQQNRLFNYAIDEHFNSLQARSADIDLGRWLNGGTEDDSIFVASVAFLSGSEEILIVDNAGNARVFSLVIKQFRYMWSTNTIHGRYLIPIDPLFWLIGPHRCTFLSFRMLHFRPPMALAYIS